MAWLTKVKTGMHRKCQFGTKSCELNKLKVFKIKETENLAADFHNLKFKKSEQHKSGTT